MKESIFSSCEKYLFRSLDSIRERPLGNANTYDSSLLTALLNNDPASEDLILDSLSKLVDSLRSAKNADFLGTSGFSIMQGLLPFINSSNEDIQASAYFSLQCLSDYLDQDELVESMMDQLICINWEIEDLDAYYKTARLSAVYVELFGRGLEKMTKPRDWMLFLPFLSNYLVKIITAIEQILVENSLFGSSNQPSLWDTIIILITNNCLDLIEFIHLKTVAQDPSAFPLDSTNIGKENGDTKRRYLAYYLLNLLFEKIVAHFDMQLSETYFKMYNPVYASRIKIHRSGTTAKVNAEDATYKPMFDIVHRTMELTLKYGLSFDKMHQLQTSIVINSDSNISAEDEMMENDRQMINARLYPLSYNGIAILLSLSLYGKTICPKISLKTSMGLFDNDTDVYKMAQKYIGIVLNLVTRCSDRVCQTDKGVFVMLYMAENIKDVVVSLNDLEKMMPGPCGNEAAFPASRIIEIITTVASTCPDSTIRFVTYKLIEKFINYGNEEAQLFLFEELLVRCPFPSMKVAAIGLLKDHVCKILDENKLPSVFASPVLVTEFVPLILQYKEEWETNQSEFWDDYSYIMQALSFYRTLYQKDIYHKYTAIWDTIDAVNSTYFDPLSKLLGKIDTKNLSEEMQIETMEHQIKLMQSDILQQRY